MLYDLADGPPEPGTLLESLFMLVTKRRMEAQYLGTRVLMEAVLAPHVKETTLSKTNKLYLDSMFPHLRKGRSDEEKDAKEAMKHWVNRGPMRVTPLDSPDHRRDRRRAKMARQRKAQYLSARPSGRKL
jgi:hypothetical protein